MDALALLCTLHADGPATLKRLRAMGCGSLALLLERDVDALAEGLDVPPAAARRLLREARLLRERVGVDTLEAEEAPPAALGAGSPADGAGARRPSIPDELPDAAQPELGRSELDSGDRDLVARIVGGRADGEPSAHAGPAPETSAPETSAPETSAPESPALDADPRAEAGGAATRDEPSAAEDDPASDPEPDVPQPTAARPASEAPSVPAPRTVAPSSFGAGVLDTAGASAETASHAAEVEEPVADPEPEATCELRPGSLPGLDEALIEDLLAAGLDTYARIAAADTLGLTRSLGVSFAQARRMRFLARREAEASSAATYPAERPYVVPAAGRAEAPASEAPSSEAPAPEPVAAESVPEPVEPADAHSSDADPSEAAPSSSEPKSGAPAASPPATEATDEPPARKAFWESRILRETEAAAPDGSEGERVDPSEIEAPPRFGDRFARAAAEGRLRRSRTSPGRTVLGWNFEVPRPEAEDLPLASLGHPEPNVGDEDERRAARDGAPAEGDDVAAGPFA